MCLQKVNSLYIYLYIKKKKKKLLNVKYLVIVQISWIISTGQPKSKVNKIHTLCLDKTPQILSFPLFPPSQFICRRNRAICPLEFPRFVNSADCTRRKAHTFKLCK